MNLLKTSKSIFYWNIFLTEGKNREIKRIFEYFNILVKYIHRYEFAGIKIGSLKEGKVRKINKSIIKLMYKKYD